MSKYPVNQKHVKITGIIAISVLVGIAPLLGMGAPRSAASSPQALYPDFNTSTGCGNGLDNSIPGFGLFGSSSSSFAFTFCGTANQTLTLTNASFAMKFDPFGTLSPTITVTLSDNGTVIAESAATPTTLSGCCCPTLHTFSMSPSNGGLMRSGDRLVLTVSFTGNTGIIDACTGSPYVSTLLMYGTPQAAGQTTLSPQECQNLLNIPYQKLAVGSNVTEYVAPSQVFTVPNVTNWNWYFVPISSGQNPNAVIDQIITQLWESGHGQSFDFFVGTYKSQLGVVLRTDYSLVYECSG
jgi:hypothetical protein